jgi:hypothetical protein
MQEKALALDLLDKEAIFQQAVLKKIKENYKFKLFHPLSHIIINYKKLKIKFLIHNVVLVWNISKLIQIISYFLLL